MKRFLFQSFLFFAIPVTVLIGIFFITDPFCILKSFSFDQFDSNNRDYFSSELFIQNYDSQHYDSYIFCSSRGGSLNTYHWRQFLPEGSNPFLFQAWSETLTGMEQKIDYITEHNYPIKNAILLIDDHLTFNVDLSASAPTTLRHPAFSHQPVRQFNFKQLSFFLQKPSQWFKAVSNSKYYSDSRFKVDPISNDWLSSFHDFSCPPPKDSLCDMPPLVRASYIRKIKDMKTYKEDRDMINEQRERQLRHIQDVFSRHGTDYRIIVSPDLYRSPMTEHDLMILCDIFGEENVFNFSDDKTITEDYTLYRDTGHFGYYLGWYIIEQVYNSSQ